MRNLSQLDRLLFVAAIVFLSYIPSYGQCPMPTNTPAGVIDTCFFIGTGFSGTPSVLALQPDGKVLVGGSFTSYNGIACNYICRLNTDGSLDATFAPTGSGVDGGVYAIALQPDGKILVGGTFLTYNGNTAYRRIYRLNADGSLDATFSTTGTGVDGIVRALALQPDGKVLVGGSFSSYNGSPQSRICRLNADGSLDATFAPTGTGVTGSGFNSQVFTLALQPDGKVLVGGSFLSYNGIDRIKICRLNADGTLDASFDPGTGFTGPVTFTVAYSIALQPDGKVLVGGQFFSFNGTARNHICRLNADGTIDATFAPSGTGLNGSTGVRSIALQPDSKVVVGGYFTQYDGTPNPRICRLNADGSLDATFA